MSMLTPGWLKKALHLRSIVLCSPLNKLPDTSLDAFDAMRSFRRGTIGFVELKRRTQADHGPSKPMLHEAAEIYGWNIQAALFDWNGVAWWLVSVARKNTPTDKDRVILAKVLVTLGCDDPDRDALSVSDFDDVIAEGIPFMYAWRNMLELQEVQIHKMKRGKDMIRIVPRGSRASDGYESLPMTDDDVDNA